MKKCIKKRKAALIFYLVIVAGVLLISYNNKQYENKKSISADIGFTDIQK